jgi:hypothetical protein
MSGTGLQAQERPKDDQDAYVPCMLEQATNHHNEAGVTAPHAIQLEPILPIQESDGHLH